MGINSVGTDGTGKSGKAQPPAPVGISEEQGAQAIAALLSPRKREDKPASKRDAAPAKKPVKTESTSEEQHDEDEVESDDEFNIEDESSDDASGEADEPNEDDDPADDDRDADERNDDDDEQDDQESLLDLDVTARVKHPKSGEVLTVQELFDSRLRTADYTRKTQELAKLRKEAEPELKAVREERVQLAESLKDMEQALLKTTPQEPNWDEEFQNDPEGAPALYARWDIHKKRMAAIADQRAAADAKVFEDQKKEVQAHMQRENEALDAAMGWKGDTTKAKAGRDAIWNYGKEVGFEDQQLLGVSDHRLQVIMDKARRWDEAQKKGKGNKAPEEPTKVVRPGSSSQSNNTPRPVKELNRAKKRLAQTGNIHDAKVGISLLLQAERAPKSRRR